MTQISTVIIEDAEAFIKENYDYMCTDRIAAVYPCSKFNPDGITKYYDEEEDVTKDCTMADHVRALVKLVDLVSNKQIFVGGVTNPMDLLDLGNWDTEVVDAYYQLIYHDEVIYG